MRHPFDGIIPPAAAPSPQAGTTRRSVLRTLLAGAAGLFGLGASASADSPPGPRFTTQAVGEEGGRGPTYRYSEEGRRVTTYRTGEEGGRRFTTQAIGE